MMINRGLLYDAPKDKLRHDALMALQRDFFPNHAARDTKGMELELPIIHARDDNTRTCESLLPQEMLGLLRKISLDNPLYEMSNDGMKLVYRPDPQRTIGTDVGSGLLEITTAPAIKIRDIETQLRAVLAEVLYVAEKSGFYVLGYGGHPASEPSRELLMPFQRTKAINNLLDIDTSTVLLTTIASVQTHNAVGMDNLIRFYNAMNGAAPAMIAISGNSPILAGKDTYYSDYRSQVWNSCGSSFRVHKEANMGRVGIPPRFGNYEEYWKWMVSFTPMFTERDGHLIMFEGPESMSRYMSDGIAYGLRVGDWKRIAITPTVEDILIHEGSSLWTEARIKSILGTVEGRTFPAQTTLSGNLSTLAFSTGLLANLNEAEDRIYAYTVEDARASREHSSLFGVHGDIAHGSAIEYAKDVLEIAKRGLAQDEKAYLEPLMEMAEDHTAPSDLARAVYGARGIAGLIEHIKLRID